MHTRKHHASALRWTGLVLFILLLSTVVHAQITPLGDSYTNSADPTTNYGAKTLLDVDGATQYTYIQFDLASIPSGASVSQATLKLYVNSVTTAGSFNVDYVNGSWTEGTINWSSSPALGTTIASNVSVTTADKNQYILVNVTSAVQAWLSGSEANDGIALVANSTFNATFDSKENTTTSHPPELDIVFAGGTGTITGVTTSSTSGLTGGGTTGTLNLSLLTSCSANQVLEWSGSAWACAPAGTGTLTGITAGTGISVSGGAPSPTIGIDTSVVPQLSAANTFNNNQTVNANVIATNLTATQTVSGNAVNATTGFSLGGNLFDYGSYRSQDAFLGFAGNGSGSQGINNTAVGYQADARLLGTSNTALGTYALQGPASGSYSGSANTAVGTGALEIDDNGSNNTAVGFSSGLTLDGSSIEGWYNTFLGLNSVMSTGTLNNATAIGANAEVAESNALVLGSIDGVNNAIASTNVGIGTTTPSHLLEVDSPNAQSAQIAMVSAGSDAAISLNNTASGGREYWIDSGSGTAGIGAGNFAVWDNVVKSARLAINSSGQVGIGTINPTRIFQISQGLGHAQADGWDTYSSRRWKTNIHTLDDALGKVEQLRGVSYDLKGSGKHEIGVIAEEVGAVVPEVVSYEKNGGDASGVDYGRLTALLIEATKEQQTLIHHQQQQINTQQSQIKQLTRQVRAVQAALKASGRPHSEVRTAKADVSSVHQ